MAEFFSTLFWMLVVAVGLLIYIALKSYNRLQGKAQAIREKASNVQIAISKKLSLVNQLIDVVRNFQEAEQFTHLKISQDASGDALMSAYQQSGTLLTTLQGMVQRFPELRASEQYHRLVDSIQHCEADIQGQREGYNAVVRDYNATCLSIPTVFVARLMGFASAPYLEFDLSGAQAPNTLKDFKTDDGERLQQLLGAAGGRIASASRLVVEHASDASRQLAGAVKDKVQAASGAGAGASAATKPDYFFVLPGGVPEGPLTLEVIRATLATRGVDRSQVTIARPGSTEWQPLPDDSATP